MSDQNTSENSEPFNAMTARISHLFGSRRWRVARNGILAGLLAGTITCGYRFMIGKATEFARWAYAFIGDHAIAIALFFVAALAASALIWAAIRFSPDASGSGIPQVKGLLQGDPPMRPLRVLAARFTGAGAAALFGLSLGREGPSIHIGAASAELLKRPLRATSEEERHLMTSGAAAGLSAAFNAPVSGLMFGIEGLHRSFSPLVIASAATGALAADVIAGLAFGSEPVLQFGTVETIPISLLWAVVPLGIIAGLVGALFNQILLGSQMLQHLPGPAPLFVALALALPCGLFFPLALGGGEKAIDWAEFGATSIGAVLIILLVKVVFTAVSFGSGVPGGIFMPILAIGTLTGSAYALALQNLGLPEGYQAALAVCGMAGLLAATVRTPLTSILLTAEMTGNLSHLLPIATAVIIAIFVADALRVPPIYDALLERRRQR
ncbi:ClC family H(+)/Cl(-) exchange transporter [Ancrocorticia populi]|uniref:ClC family H(+)/Cl(-) exchange transporter n=1 Tax=Ancrocorticia populi TaxID=2175228 RepID=UPI003F91ECC6